MEHPDWYAGDWALETHQVTLEDKTGTVTGERTFAHSGAGMAAQCEWLLAIGGNRDGTQRCSCRLAGTCP